MKKIILGFSILVTFLFSFSYYEKNEFDNRVELLSNENTNCDKYDSIVNITTANNLINVSGFVVYSDNKYTYIATSALNYENKYNYEIVFSDYSRKEATLVGIAKEDKLVLFKVEKDNHCSVLFSKSKLLDKLERVDVLGIDNYHIIQAEAYVSEIGVCRNCGEETYKKYYYSILTADINDAFIGSGVFDKSGQLMGMIIEKIEDFNLGIAMLDVDKIYSITYQLVNNGKYQKNYIKYNLLDVNSLTKHEKYLYSLDEGLTNGVLVSSIHYLNYLTGGLNQGMVISKVNGVKINNCYELDNELSKYRKGTKVELTTRTIFGDYKIYQVKL